MVGKKTGNILKFLLELCIACFCALGVIAAYYLITVGIYEPLDNLDAKKYTDIAQDNSESMRNITINIGRGCSTSSYCWAMKIWRVTKNFDYVPLGLNHDIYTPKYTYDTQSGNCVTLSVMIVSMLSSVGVKSEIVCMPEHCALIVPHWNRFVRKDGYMYIDPANKILSYHDDNESVRDMMFRRYNESG